MNLQFKSELKGGELFKKAVLFLIGFVVVVIAMAASISKQNYGASAVLYLLLIVGAIAIQYVFLSSLVNAVSFNNEQFHWQGSFGKYVWINIKGVLLSCITFLIYLPWYEKELTDYMAENIKYPGKDVAFHGEAKKLLKYIFLSFILPLIAIIAIYTALLSALGTSGAGFVISIIVYLVGLFVIMAFYYFFVYKWFINFTFGEDEITLEAEMKETVFYLLGQFFLIIITFGIYAFAANVKIFEYFTNRVSFTNTAAQKRFLLFTGRTIDGFLLTLGQTLLSYITLGVYTPWAFAKVQNWFISNVELQDTVSLEDQYN